MKYINTETQNLLSQPILSVVVGQCNRKIP
jgi:hypothetical protein